MSSYGPPKTPFVLDTLEQVDGWRRERPIRILTRFDW